jgi:hypothetical protein
VVTGAGPLTQRSSSASPQRYRADEYEFEGSASTYEDAYDDEEAAAAAAGGGGKGVVGKKGGDGSKWWEDEYLDYEPGGHKGGRR